MFWHVSVHQSVCPHLGGTPARYRWGVGVSQPGGYPCQGIPHLGYPTCRTWPGWYPCQGGTPPQVTPPVGPGRGGTPARRGSHLRYPPVRPAQGYPCWGVPHLGYPLSDLARRYPYWGVLHLRYPPHWTWLVGGTPVGVPHLGPPLPSQTWPGGTPARGGRVPHLGWSTWYTAVGMPLAFTQEDFLV